MITGISTGALIAPFAFIGAKGDATLEKLYTTTSAADVFEFGGTHDGLTDTWPLKRQIERTVTASLLNEIAAEHRAGRRLRVVTTEQDSAADPLGHGRHRRRRRACSADALSRSPSGVRRDTRCVPARDDQRPGHRKRMPAGMHADGSITVPFYLAPGRLLFAEDSERLPAPAIYLVVNHRLRPELQIAQRTVLDVLGRALSAAIKAQVASTLTLTRAFARRPSQSLYVALLDARFDRTARALRLRLHEGFVRAWPDRRTVPGCVRAHRPCCAGGRTNELQVRCGRIPSDRSFERHPIPSRPGL